MRPDDDADVQHRARLLESSLHKVLDERARGVRNGNGNGEIAVGYGKWWAKLRGNQITTVLVVLLALGFVAYLLYQHDVEQRAASARIETALHEANEIQQAILWVNSQSESERAKLNLMRPKRITEMQR